ncbi:MAG: hypothetical protein U0411_13475 [Thermodesulfovibrionales bacterium]
MEKQVKKAIKEEDLDKYFQGIALDIIDANLYLRLYQALLNSIEEHKEALTLSNIFWSYTLGSLYDAARMALCRVYDSQPSSVNLCFLLGTIKKNLSLFTEECFRKRLKDNPDVDSLAMSQITPSTEELDKDISSVFHKNNPTVSRLMKVRNNALAHRGVDITLGEKAILEELQELAAHALNILNKYSTYFRASSYLMGVPGEDDYKVLLDLLKRGFHKRRE